MSLSEQELFDAQRDGEIQRLEAELTTETQAHATTADRLARMQGFYEAAVEKLRAETQARQQAERALSERIAAKDRAFKEFGHTAERLDGKCQCPYCLGDAEALAEMAAEYELQLHSARTENEALRDNNQSIKALFDERAAQLTLSEQARAQAEQALLTAVAPTTLIAAAHMLRACADQIERLAIGYGSEQMRAIAARLDDGAGVVRLSLGLTVPQETTTDETP